MTKTELAGWLQDSLDAARNAGNKYIARIPQNLVEAAIAELRVSDEPKPLRPGSNPFPTSAKPEAPPNPPKVEQKPRYDDVYLDGLKWLDTL